MSFASYDPNYRRPEEQASAEALGFGDRRQILDHHFDGARWMSDTESKICLQCRSSFDDVINRRHHCRYCGGLFCKACSQRRAIIPEGKCLLPPGEAADAPIDSKHDITIPQRVCGKCADDLGSIGVWMEDHESSNCLQCQTQFNGIFITRHHCRYCGGLFCNSCTNGRLLIPLGKCLLPPSEEITRTENELDCRTPQRVCGPCGAELLPMQEELQGNMARSTVELNMDRNSFTRFLNLPIKITLQDEIRKATNTLHNYMPDNTIDGGDTIPKELLWGCTGIAFLTVVKGGFFFSGTVGTGCVVGRLPDGSWSAPSAICLINVGWGFQVGGEVTDVIFVLNSMEALESFMGRAQVTLGTELGISVGPLGRTAGSDLRAGKGGVAAAFAYAHSRGLFVGVSIEAGVVINRPDVNEAFYGVNHKTRAILNGSVPQPKAAHILYKALHEVESQPAPWEIMQARMQYQHRRLANGAGGQRGGYRSGQPVPSLRSQYSPNGYVPSSIANPSAENNTVYNNAAPSPTPQPIAVPDEFADDFGGPDDVPPPTSPTSSTTTIVLSEEERQLMEDAALAAALQDEEVQAYEETAREAQAQRYGMPGAGGMPHQARGGVPPPQQSSHPAVARAEAARRQQQQQQQQYRATQPNQGVHPALMRHGIVGQGQAQGQTSSQHPAMLRAQQASQYQNNTANQPVHPAILRNGGQQAVDPRRARGAGEGQWEYERRMRLLDARLAEMGHALPPTQREFATPASAQQQPAPQQQAQQQPAQQQTQTQQQQSQQQPVYRTLQQQVQASPVVAPVPPSLRAAVPRTNYQQTSSYSIAPPDGYASNSLPVPANDKYIAAPAPYGNEEDSIGFVSKHQHQPTYDPSNPFVAAAANVERSTKPTPTTAAAAPLNVQKAKVPDLFGDVPSTKSDLFDGPEEAQLRANTSDSTLLSTTDNGGDNKGAEEKQPVDSVAVIEGGVQDLNLTNDEKSNQTPSSSSISQEESGSESGTPVPSPVPRVPLVSEFDEVPLQNSELNGEPVSSSAPNNKAILNEKAPSTIISKQSEHVNEKVMQAQSSSPQTPQTFQEEEDVNPFADEDDIDGTGIVL